MTTALSKDVPDGRPSAQLREVVDSLVEASIPERWKDASGSLAVDWSHIESHFRPPEKKVACARMPRRRGGGASPISQA